MGEAGGYDGAVAVGLTLLGDEGPRIDDSGAGRTEIFSIPRY
jgi:hypothetical protein